MQAIKIVRTVTRVNMIAATFPLIKLAQSRPEFDKC